MAASLLVKTVLNPSPLGGIAKSQPVGPAERQLAPHFFLSEPSFVVCHAGGVTFFGVHHADITFSICNDHGLGHLLGLRNFLTGGHRLPVGCGGELRVRSHSLVRGYGPDGRKRGA